MVYNKATYTGFINSSASDIATCTDPLQFCIEAAESDHKLFEALITVDMTEVANNNGTINLSESDLSYMVETATNGIMDRLKALVTKFKEMVSSLFSKFSTFVSNLVSNDEKLYAKYKDHVVPAKIKGCPIKGNTTDNAQFAKANEISSRIMAMAIKAANGYDKDLTSTVDGMNKDLEELKTVDVVNKEDKPIVDKIDVNDICATMKTGYKKQVEFMNNSKQRIENLIKNAQLEVKNLEIKSTNSADAEKYNKAYESLSKILATTSKALSAATSVAKTSIALDRSNFIKLGNWVLGGGKAEEKKPEETAKQEAFNMLIDIANESFCESTWEEAV